MVRTIVAVVATFGAVIVATPSAATLPACPTEDSVSCYWDATSRGNGIGRSFVTDGAGVVHYVR